MTHPFIKETTVDRNCIGNPVPRIDRDFMLLEFCTALAAELGATIKGELEHYFASGAIDCGDDLVLTVRSEYGAKIGRVEISAWTGLARDLASHEWPKTPSATFDASRPLPVLAKAIRQKLIDPSRPMVDATRAKLADRNAAADQFAELIARMKSEFPGVSINRTDAKALSADVYLNTDAGYLTGTLYPDGRISFQRVSLNSADNVRRLLSIVAGV